MDPFIDLTNSLAFLNQQIGMRQMANEYHERVKNQVRNPYMHMAQVPYGGTHIGTIITRVGNIALAPHGIQAITLFNLHKSKDQA